jgi:PAS domain-containing protein
MKRLPLIAPLTSSEAAFRPEDPRIVGIERSVQAAESSDQFNSREFQSFDQRLRAAEEEARFINETQGMENRELLTNDLDVKCSPLKHEDSPTKNSPIKYSYDIQSADEEILSNVKEVQRFNEELEGAEEEARSIDEGWSTAKEEVQTQVIDPDQSFDLATSIVEVVREPLLILDNRLCVKKANRAFYRTFCRSEEDTETRSIYELADNAWDIPTLKVLLDKVLLDNRAYEEVEVESEFPQVGRKTLRLNVRRVSGGEMILMSIRDVTPRRRTEVELHRVQDELRQGQKWRSLADWLEEWPTISTIF